MIVGIGTDLIEIERVSKACSNEGFMKRCFTIEERKLIDKRNASAAGNFAVKEAVSKALGTGFSAFKLADIEVLRDEKGKPYVNLYNNALAIAKSLEIDDIFVSISDTKEMAMAYVVAQKRG